MVIGFNVYDKDGKYLGRSGLAEVKAAFALYLWHANVSYKENEIEIFRSENGVSLATCRDREFVLAPVLDRPRPVPV